MPDYLRPTTWISFEPNLKVKTGSPAVLTQSKVVPADYKGEVETEWTLVEEIVPTPIIYDSLKDSPTAPLSPISYVDLDIQKAFHIPLPYSLKFVQFTNCNGTAKWDPTDETRLRNVSSAKAIASGLKGKIVLIGDRTNLFEYFGVRTPGPFVFRNRNRAIQIVLLNGIFKVTDMLLQLIETPATASQTVADTSPPRIVLLDKPVVETKNGVLFVQIRTLIMEEQGTSQSTPTQSIKWIGSSKEVFTTSRSIKVQMRIS